MTDKEMVVEKVSEEVTEQPQKKITIKDVVAAEVQQLIANSKQYRDEITAAKTSTKKKYFKKKLKKNNEEVFKYMMALERLRINDEMKAKKSEEPAVEETEEQVS